MSPSPPNGSSGRSAGPPTGFFLHPASALHDTGWAHPEHQGRLRALASSVGRDLPALHGRVEQYPPGKAGREDLARVHTDDHIGRVRERVARAAAERTVLELEGDTRVSGASWDAALGAVAASLGAAEGVAEGRLANAFVATRPPGHHATPERAMGFCLFNSVAIVARWLQARELAERILIVDWDVHHGNGTQDVFWCDPTVYYLSLHQAGHWPGTGHAHERGEGRGRGFTLNVPVPPGTGGGAYREHFERALDRAFGALQPDFVLVSSGFDALAADPLGNLVLDPADFHGLARSLRERAEAVCSGRLVALLEGGYDPSGTGQATVAVLRGLAGMRPADPQLTATEPPPRTAHQER